MGGRRAFTHDLHAALPRKVKYRSGLDILNSILHLEPPCATPSSHILNYLIPPTPALRIIFRSPPPPRVTFENGIALSAKSLCSRTHGQLTAYKPPVTQLHRSGGEIPPVKTGEKWNH